MKKIKIIAELGSVHDGSFGNCLKLIELAKKCGADIVKLQHHISDEETLKDAPNPSFFQSENRYDYFKRTAFSADQWKKILFFSKKHKIGFMCSIFSIASYKFLKKIGVKNIKIPSGEVTNLPLLNELSNEKSINFFLSTGMSSWKEIEQSVNILKKNKLSIFQCTSMYPCPPKYSGINVIKDLYKKYNKKYSIGFSDHTSDNIAAILALSQGAVFFEKHLTFSKDMYGSDAKYASEPQEFKKYCESLKKSEVIFNSCLNKKKIKLFRNMRRVFQKSIYYNNNFLKGHKIQLDDLCFKKPDIGISATDYKLFLGKKLIKPVFKNKPLQTIHF
jgi:N-acetylneuraminate synthase